MDTRTHCNSVQIPTDEWVKAHKTDTKASEAEPYDTAEEEGVTTGLEKAKGRASSIGSDIYARVRVIGV